MTSSPGASKALEAAVLAIRADQAGEGTEPPGWLEIALHLHHNAAGLDDIARFLRDAGYPEESVEFAVAAVRSDVRRLGLFRSRRSDR